MELEIRIRKKLNEFTLDLDLQETEGRIGILGASGCGKSMTLKSIAGIVKPDSGKIRIGERVLYDSTGKINLPPQKRRIGYLFQNYALFPTMTVEQNIMAGLSGSRGENRRRAAEMMEKFHVSNLANRYPLHLSGGQQQRVALARLMAYEPEVILLDEPFSAMDSFLKDQLQQQMEEMLKEYRGSMILVSHNRDEIYRFCHRLIVMDQGSVVCEGETKEAFANPRRRAAARLTGCKNYTGLVRRDSHHAYLTDWGMELQTEREIPEGTDSLGYRAHFFVPVWGKRAVNSFPVQVADSAQLPFEKNYYLIPQGKIQPGNPEYICWFAQRSIKHEVEEKGMPDYLGMNERDMLFLQG